MSDRFDEAAREYANKLGMEFVGETHHALWLELHADAFRWYEEHRAKQTCEWKWNIADHNAEVSWQQRGYWATECGEAYHKDEAGFLEYVGDHRCPGCGRRIVEAKEARGE
jgi:hypothetical protein